MDQNTKRDRPSDISGADGDRKRPRFPAHYEEEEDDDVAALLNVDLEAFTVLQELLEVEKSPEKAISGETVSPEKEVFPAVQETCGSVFSYGDSSVMASFDFAGFAAFCGGAWGSEEVREGDVDVGKGSDGWDYSEEFDGLLGRFFGEEVCEN